MLSITVGENILSLHLPKQRHPLIHSDLCLNIGQAKMIKQYI